MEWRREPAPEHSGVGTYLILGSFVVVKRRWALALLFGSGHVPAASEAAKRFAAPEERKDAPLVSSGHILVGRALRNYGSSEPALGRRFKTSDK